MRPLVTMGVVLVGAAAAACRVDRPPQIAGCFRFDAPIFQWFVYDRASQSVHTEASPVVELLPAPDPLLMERPRRPHPAFGVRMPALTDTGIAHRYALLSFWGLVAQDSIWLVWSDGYQGWHLQLRLGPGVLYGSATEITDMGDVERRHLEPVRATRIPCPERLLPSTSSSEPIHPGDLLRGVVEENDLSSAPVLSSWPRRGQLVGVDTTGLRGTVDFVIVVDSSGHVEPPSILVSAPSNTRLAALVPALLRALVFRPGTLARGFPVRSAIGRHLVLSPDSLVFQGPSDTTTVGW